MLGLPGLTTVNVADTLKSLTCTLELNGDLPTCPDCGSDKRRAHGALTYRAWDTPMRGKPTRLIIKRPRYRCRCGKTYAKPGDVGIDRDFPSMTTRLVRHIQNAVLRRPYTVIAVETGVSSTNIGKIAVALAEKLYDHRFPTPEVLAIDDIRIRKKLFTVVTDGRSGKPIALVEGGSEKAINAELARRSVNPAAVNILVSDLGGSNLAVYKSMFKRHGTIHVADKWHVLKGVQEALSTVINKRVDHLRRRRAWCEKVLKKRWQAPLRKWDTTSYLKECQARIDKLVGSKKELMGAKIVQTSSPQLTFNFYVNRAGIAPLLDRHPTVGKAFWAKMRLHMVYTRMNRLDADAQIDRFIVRASSKSIAPQMKIIVDRVLKHRKLILNYFDVLAPNSAGKLTAPTTGPTERRNGNIKTAWKTGRGLHAHKIFSMRALYEPWLLDVDIGVCSHKDCSVVDGPYPNRDDRLMSVVGPAYRHYCAAHVQP